MSRELVPVVSVVVASHRPGYVVDLVSSLGPQVRGELEVEVIVVADYPVEELGSKYGEAVWLYWGDRSISAKRNRGVEQARGRYVAFIDDDCIPSEGWLPAAVGYLEANSGAAGVEGRTVIGDDGRGEPYQREYRRLEKRGYRTNNMCFRIEAFRGAGMFDERFTVQREDIDLAFTLIESGMTIGYNRDMVVNHRLRHDERWDLLKNCANRRFDPLLYRKHRRLYRAHIGSPFPPGLALMLSVLAAVPTSAAVDWRWAAGWGAAYLILGGLLVVRRTGLWSGRWALMGREWLSHLVAPVVLAGAVAYGSLKYRTLLLL